MAENDIGKSLSALLEDPEALSRVMKLAGTLMGNMQAQEEQTGQSDGRTTDKATPPKKPDEDEKTSEHSESSVPDFSALPALLGSIGAKNTSDPKCALLTALKPYMAHGRAEKIDSLIKILKLSELAGGFLHTSGLL